MESETVVWVAPKGKAVLVNPLRFRPDGTCAIHPPEFDCTCPLVAYWARDAKDE